MNRKPRKQKLVAEINITPFTDVILVLLVIFMITTPLIFQSSIKVKLPQAQSGEPIKGARAASQVNVTITNEGLLYLDDVLVTRKEFRERMRLIRKDNPGIAVILRSDRLVKFENVVGVLDILSELGIKNLNIASTTEG